MTRRHYFGANFVTTATDVEIAFGQSPIRVDWRVIALKQAFKEFAATLSSLLAPYHHHDDTGVIVALSPSEELLLSLIPELLPEAARRSHAVALADAVKLLRQGHQIDLRPLIDQALADLQGASRDPSTEPGGESHS